MSVSANQRSLELWPVEQEVAPPSPPRIIVRARLSLETALAEAPRERPKDFVEEDDAEECRTPTSQEHRIPQILKLPPAPRRPKPVPRSYKRKLSELRSVSVDQDEIQSFFETNQSGICRKIKKRRGCEKE